MNNDRIIITTVYNRTAAFYMSDGKAVRIRVLNDEKAFSLGTIVIGRVKKILESSAACFVDIGDDKDYFMSVPKDISSVIFTDGGEHSCIRNEDHILVQISSEEVKLKAPCVTTKISLRSRYVVIEPGKGVSFSGKLNAEFKKKIVLPPNIDTFSSKYHIIIRTESAELNDMGQLARDLAGLDETYSLVIQKAGTSRLKNVLYRESSGVKALLEEWLKFGAGEVISDLDKYKDDIASAAGIRNVTYTEYKDRDYPPCKLYKLESAVDNALGKRVSLRSGAFLVIEQGETLTAIDVNSGHRVKGDKEEISYSINIEAVSEIFRQLKLRNISGMILVDFINTTDPDHESGLIEEVRKYIKNDDVMCKYVDITGLGLMEITRKRVRMSLAEQWKASN